MLRQLQVKEQQTSMACISLPKTSQTTLKTTRDSLYYSLEDSAPTGKDKTSIIFSAKHEPGSLYHALGEFAKRNINLTKIESRPTKKTAWEYNFYLDFEGHRTEAKCAEALKALGEIRDICKDLRFLP